MTTLRQKLAAKTEEHEALLASVESARAAFERAVNARVIDNGGNAWVDDHHRFLGMFNARFPRTISAASIPANTEQ